MNKIMKVLAGTAIVILVAAGMALQGALPRPCCVAGEYKGSHIDSQQPNCPAPQAEFFTMTIQQAERCGTLVWGKIVDTSGHVSEFKGTVGRRLGGCCVVTASFADAHPAGHVIEFEFTLCLVAGKLQGKGTYKDINSGDPCKLGGTLRVQQI